jgi:hypothetical protein
MLGRVVRASCILFSVASLVACSGLGGGGGGGGAPPANTAKANDALEDPNHPGLEACKGSISASGLDNALEIANGFKQSCHELIVCGGLSASFSTAVIGVVINAATGTKAGGGFTFDATGTYTTKPSDVTGTSMDLQLFLAADTSFGKAGDLVKFNLLSIDSYFLGATLEAKASIDTTGKTQSSLTITFTGKGPAFELLGLGDLQSPIKVDAAKISEALGKIQIATKVHVDDKQGRSSFRYDLDSPKMSLGAIVGGEPLPMTLSTVTGGRADTGQTMKVTKWEIRYLDTSAGGYLDGTIGVSIAGGGFPYGVTFEYPRRKDPDVSLRCGE